MAEMKLGVVLHGVTGRMGDVAHRALQEIASRGGVPIDGDSVLPVPIGVGRDADKLAAYAAESGLADCTTSVEEALDRARAVNADWQVYHNAVTTGARHDTMLSVLPLLDPSQTAVFCEKPVAANYREGWEIVEALERGRFRHGVVHDMLETPGVRKACQLLPGLRPRSCQMVFGYEVGDGTSGNPDYRGQRPDFNWTLAEGGGGIILDMCHEAYLSNALFGTTERLSAVARLLVPERRSAETDTVIACDVEDHAAIRREHTSGVVNTSVWTWCRRVNSEFGPLEITVEGEAGTIVFGLQGLKVQWRESAPALRWKDALEGKAIPWREFWEYAELEPRNAFAVELERFIRCMLLREPYPYDATRALDWLGEVEAIYQSAARDGAPITHDAFLHYPDQPEPDWQPERLQGRLRH
jgi:predicted dehydrogenase